MKTNPEVIVVGAGPTGLVAAAELQKRGVSVRLLEASLTRSDKSRALVVQPRTLEVLDRMQALGDLLDVGQRSLGLGLYIDGRVVVDVHIDDFGFEGTPYPHLLFVSQAETERVLERHAESLGVEVERGMKVLGVSQSDAAVELDVETPRGRERLRSRWVVGADGAHSLVRKATGLRFEGDAYPQDFALADVTVDWEFPDGGIRIFFDSRGVFACLPLGPRRFRFIMVRAEENEAREPSVEEVLERARAATHRDVRIVETHWLARFRLHHRGVDHYRRGRLLVAGDAAHIHSPAGGQGMNTGIQDAFNLAWKLALVVQRRVPETLLDSYHAERHPVGRRLLRFTDRMFRLGTSSNPFIAAMRRAVLPLSAPFVLSDASRRARAFAFVSQLGIRYASSPLNREPRDRGSLAKRPRAGDRAPDAPLAGTTLFQQLRGTGFHLVCFVRGPAAPDLARLKGLVTPVVIAQNASEPPLLRDPEGAAFARYGVAAEGLFLIRPDGHIATRAPGLDLSPIFAYFAEGPMAGV